MSRVRDVMASNPGITTEEIYERIKGDYINVNQRWLRDAVGMRKAMLKKQQAKEDERAIALAKDLIKRYPNALKELAK